MYYIHVQWNLSVKKGVGGKEKWSQNVITGVLL